MAPDDENARLRSITANAARLLAELPADVLLVAAAKSRAPDEVRAAIAGGVRAVGHNYVQEARAMADGLAEPVSWHLIGHLQRNKVAAAIALFDMVQTVDSRRLADALERRCAESGRRLAVLLEVNSGGEPHKAGALPGDVDALAEHVAGLAHLRLQGLMTVGPLVDTPEEMRPYFWATRRAFERLANVLPAGAMHHLSMGMSDSYRVAVEEGATIVRVGTLLFGPRPAATSP